MTQALDTIRNKPPLAIVALCGGFRTGSYNAGLLVAAQELAPAGMVLRIAGRLDALPWFNQDLEEENNGLDAVEALRRDVLSADGLLVATPEYNAGIPGVLKNAIDWLSRPPARLMKGLPVAMMGASPGRSGTVNAQAQLRQMLDSMSSITLPEPSFTLAGAAVAFDAKGRLIDADARRRLQQHLVRFAEMTARNRLKRSGLGGETASDLET